MNSLRIRPMRPDEAVNGATAEGWNPGLADDACFAAADPEGFFIGELKGALAAIVSCVITVRVSRSSISYTVRRAADQPGPDWMTAQQVIEQVLKSGYTQVTKLEADDGRWEGEGIKNGQKMDFHADPKTGVITSEELDD